MNVVDRNASQVAGSVAMGRLNSQGSAGARCEHDGEIGFGGAALLLCTKNCVIADHLVRASHFPEDWVGVGHAC